MYYVYLLECLDGSLYTGITTDVLRRFKEHCEGTGAKYTKAKEPVRMVYQEEYPDRSSASKREAEIKKADEGEETFIVSEVGIDRENPSKRMRLEGFVVHRR